MKRHSYRDDPECMETIRRVQRQLIDTLDYAIKKQGYTRHDAALFAGIHAMMLLFSQGCILRGSRTP